MSSDIKKHACFALCALLLLGAHLGANGCSRRSAGAAGYSMEQDQQKARVLVERMRIAEVLGPLAPVALSPFFGLACLSGTSILCDRGIISGNDFLVGNEVLNNPYVFLVFLALAVVTSAPKLVTASKIFAELTDRLETYAGIISYAVILMLTGENSGPEREVALYSAGIFAVTHSGLLACAAAVNIFVISTVKFFFELLALISPIPTLDAIFEISNKAVAGAIALIYAFNPWVAFVLNLILFFICLAMFNWANRRLRYLRALLLDPMVFGIKRRLIKSRDCVPDARAGKRILRRVPDAALVVKCFPTRRFGRIKKKGLCYLVFSDSGISLVKPRFLRPPVIGEVAATQLSPEVQEGLVSYSIDFKDDRIHKHCALVFGKAYSNMLGTIRQKILETSGSKESLK